MTLSDLFFLMSVLFVLVLSIRIAVSAIRRRWQTTGRLGRFLGLFVAFYVAALIAVALFLPRRFYAPGERRCFDDWCIAAVSAQPANNSTDGPCGNWIAAVEVSSVARRVRQRAPDARGDRFPANSARASPSAFPCRFVFPPAQHPRAWWCITAISPGLPSWGRTRASFTRPHCSASPWSDSADAAAIPSKA